MRIGVTFVTDKNGIEMARFSAYSLLLSQTDKFEVVMYCDGFELPSRDPIRLLYASRGVPFKTKPISSARFATKKTFRHITNTSYAKLAAVVDASETFDRVLYSDTDILFFKSLNLARLDFKGYPIAAAYDVAEASGIAHSEFSSNCEKNDVSPKYFNSGLIFVDAAHHDFSAVEQHYNTLVEEHAANCPYKTGCKTGDQCAWNLAFQKNWLPLPQGWNVQTSMRFTKEWRDAPARHYTGPTKFFPMRPWRTDTRESAYLAKLAQGLGVSISKPFNPMNIVYLLNGLRWKSSIKRIDQANLSLNK